MRLTTITLVTEPELLPVNKETRPERHITGAQSDMMKWYKTDVMAAPSYYDARHTERTAGAYFTVAQSSLSEGRPRGIDATWYRVRVSSYEG